MRHFDRIAFALTVVMLCSSGVARSAVLKTTGSFVGVYHRDPWGVGHFEAFLVPPDLHKALAPYEGKRIRLQVTKGKQPMNPGPAIMLAVGKVEELPAPLFQVRAKTVPARVVAGKPFQLVVEVTARGKDGALLYPVHVIGTIRQPQPSPGRKLDAPSRLIPGYTVRQLSVWGRSVQMGTWETFHARTNLCTRGGRLLLRPGASYVWVTTYPKGLPAVDGELEIRVRYAMAAPDAPYGQWISGGPDAQWHTVWQRFPVLKTAPKVASSRPAAPPLRLNNVKLTPDPDGWTHLSCTLLPGKKQQIRLPGTVDRRDGKADPRKHAGVARIHGVAADGAIIKLAAERLPKQDTPHGGAQLLKLPPAGAVIKARFRNMDRTDKRVPVRLVLAFLTDRGVQSLSIDTNAKE